MFETQTPRRARLMRVALGLSLALNLLVLGAIGGAAWRHGSAAPPARAGGPGALSYAAPYMQALPAAARREMHRQRRAVPQDTRRAGYDQMLTALRGVPFEADQAAAVLKAQGAAAAAAQAGAHDRWLAQISRMTDQERLSYADRLEARLKDWQQAQQRKAEARRRPAP